MLSFGDYIQMRNKDLHGSDIRKSEYAGIRAILEAIKENIRFIVDDNKRRIIEEFVERLMGGKDGNSVRDKVIKKK